MIARRAGVMLAISVSATASADAPVVVHAELDPVPFANGGFGGQVGLRTGHVRFAVDVFAFHVPDVVGQLGGNDGFDVKVRPSVGVYALYYLRPAGHDGVVVGGSVRYLRFRYAHDEAPGMHVDVSEVSPELIVGYQWHPLHNGLYLQPWVGLGIGLAHTRAGTVGGHTYDELPVIPFATMNLGYEHAL